jgi:hypothetical protein
MIIYRCSLDSVIHYAESLLELLLLFECEAPFARTVRLAVIETRPGRIAPKGE